MKFSERWLRTAFDPGLSSEALASLLTMAGLEVETREPVAAPFEGVVVARIAAMQPHPDAERLHVCSVDTGKETLRIVCGAPNARVGMHVACAVVGARLPGGQVKQVQLRGVNSFGMLCSERELALGSDHSGILEVDAETAPGTDLRAALELDDWVITLKLTPNRGDCLSIHGLARELAALTGGRYATPPQSNVPAVLSEPRKIFLEAGEACPRYCGRVVGGVNPAARTPAWMVRRLQRSGIRPISAVVDVTNYVMLEMGQPLHAFDHARLQGDVHIRFARGGERLKLLDGRDIDLQPKHLVIADDAAAVALAGVMGGDASAVGMATDAVFLESAYFSPEAVAEASRGLEIASDAAHRFERGVDFELAPQAIERATELLLQICGGKAGPVVEALGRLPSRQAVPFDPERVRRAIGLDIETDAMCAILQRLGVAVDSRDGKLLATPPSFRFDFAIEADVVEEVARVHGYDRIPATLPVARAPMLALPETLASAQRMKQALAARDYFEVVTFSFIDRELERDFGDEADPVALANPIASQMSVMRSSLIGSLIETVRFNGARKQDRVRIFELAACYARKGDAYDQTVRIAGVCYGAALPEQWGVPSRPVDFFDVRGDLEALLGPGNVRLVAETRRCLHPGQSARVLVRGRPAGWLGAIHPRLAQKYELAAATILFELDFELVRAGAVPAYQPVSRFPSVRRDLALVVDDTVPVAVLAQTIRSVGAPLVTDATVFDVYRGKGVAEGRKSLAFRVLLQDTEKTLTDAEVDAAVQKIVSILKEKHGAVLRA